MRYTGQSAAEIGLVIGLIAIGGIVALNVFSGAVQTQTDKLTAGVSGTIGGMLTMPGGSTGGGAGAAAGGTGGTAAGGATTGGGSATGGGTTASTFASSYPPTAAGFDQMLSELPNLIETSGASGTTKQLLAYLQQTISAEVEEGNLTETEAAEFTELANKGHRLARFLNHVETNVNANNFDYDSFADSTFTFEGQEIKGEDVTDYIDAHVFAYHVSSHGDTAWEELEKNSESSHHLETQGSLIADFQQQWQEVVQKKGDVDTPLIRVVNELTAEIMLTSNALDQTLGDIKYNKLLAKSQEAINKQVASNHVHRNSGTICTAGGGESLSTLCQ